jgi:glycerol-3-phosphate dehydrogenase
LIRDLDALEAREYDLLVVGGGVVGACVARDAALRGLHVALVERSDFASGTSANSLKLVHGGLRYLQRLELREMRESIRERSAWLRVAPHLVHPIPVLVPLYGEGLERVPVLRAALALNDLFSADRNRRLDEERSLPSGRALSPDECLNWAPELDATGLAGGVMFFDAQMYSAERLVLGVVRGAVEAGAAVANYVDCRSAQPDPAGGADVVCTDALTGSELRVRARLVVNATGSDAFHTASALTSEVRPLGYSVAMNLVLPAREHRCAFAISARAGRQGSRGANKRLFVVPWRGRTMVGTAHYPLLGEGRDSTDPERYMERFLDEVNAVWPGEPIRRDEVVKSHFGQLPVSRGGDPARVDLLRRGEIFEDRSPVLTVASVKFTTARALAQRVVDRVVNRLGKRSPSCTTHLTPLPDAPSGAFSAFVESARRVLPNVEEEVLDHLVRAYGTRYTEVLPTRDVAIQRVANGSPVISAQIEHAIRHEMAHRPEDVVERRTELGPTARGVREGMRLAAAILAPNRRHSPEPTRPDAPLAP